MDTSMGALPCPPDAMVSVSVIQVRSTPRFASESITTACWGEGNSKTRSDRSAAIKVRAWLKSISWNEGLNPRTPVSEPTPTATARITNRNLNEDERASRQAILNAVDQAKFISARLAGQSPAPLPVRRVA